ncbi:hypothetical protein Tco_0168545 [Tanacetum coccineum]
MVVINEVNVSIKGGAVCTFLRSQMRMWLAFLLRRRVSCKICAGAPPVRTLEALLSSLPASENESHFCVMCFEEEYSPAIAVPVWHDGIWVRVHTLIPMLVSKVLRGSPDSIYRSAASSVTLVLTSPTVIGAISGTASAGSTQVSTNYSYPNSLIPLAISIQAYTVLTQHNLPSTYKIGHWQSRTLPDLISGARVGLAGGMVYPVCHVDLGWTPYAGRSNGDGTGGGDECAGWGRALAWRSPV